MTTLTGFRSTAGKPIPVRRPSNNQALWTHCSLLGSGFVLEQMVCAQLSLTWTWHPPRGWCTSEWLWFRRIVRHWNYSWCGDKWQWYWDTIHLADKWTWIDYVLLYDLAWKIHLSLLRNNRGLWTHGQLLARTIITHSEMTSLITNRSRTCQSISVSNVFTRYSIMESMPCI